MMFFWKQSLSYSTKKSKVEYLTSLKSNIAWLNEFGTSSTRSESLMDFEGYIENDVFYVRRVLKVGANSFIPLVEGSFKENKGCHINFIELNISIQKTPKIILSVLNIFLGAMIILDLISGALFTVISLTSVLILLFFWLSFYLIFKSEVRKVDAFMRKVL